jgi:hypothetical protein
VVATDLDVRWLAQQAHPEHLEPTRHDIVHDQLPQGPFDLVHERLVLIHLAERTTALAHMVDALRTDGWLLAEDFDSMIGSDAYVDPMSEDEEIGNRILRAMRTLLARRGADPALGHKLPQMLRNAGLVDVTADAHQTIAGGDAVRRLQQANIAQVAGQLVEQSLIARDEIDRYLAALAERRVSPRSPLLVSAWGRRPGKAG